MSLIIYKYLIKSFINTFVFALTALCLIFLIVDLMENIDKFIDQNTGYDIVIEYYSYFFPEIIKLMTPIATLLATLFSVGNFSVNNEIVAMKSGGMSIYKIMVPFVVISLTISLMHLYFNGWIVPKSSTVKINIEREYLKKGSSYQNLINIYLRDNPLTNMLMSHYDSKSKTGSNVAIESYSDELKPRMLSRIEANSIVWVDSIDKWIAYNAIRRNYDKEENIYLESFDELEVILNFTHEQIERLKKKPNEMTFDELKDYIEITKKGGKDVKQQMIEYYGNYAFPFANLIVVLFGVPFASVRKKGGIAIQITAALVVSFLYILFTKVSQSLGYYINADPILTGWIANILFFIGSLAVLFKTRT